MITSESLAAIFRKPIVMSDIGATAAWLAAVIMRDYGKMTPCERIAYYRREIERLAPPDTQREVLLIETFQHLIAENEPLCEHGITN